MYDTHVIKNFCNRVQQKLVVAVCLLSATCGLFAGSGVQQQLVRSSSLWQQLPTSLRAHPRRWAARIFCTGVLCVASYLVVQKRASLAAKKAADEAERRRLAQESLAQKKAMEEAKIIADNAAKLKHQKDQKEAEGAKREQDRLQAAKLLQEQKANEATLLEDFEKLKAEILHITPRILSFGQSNNTGPMSKDLEIALAEVDQLINTKREKIRASLHEQQLELLDVLINQLRGRCLLLTQGYCEYLKSYTTRTWHKIRAHKNNTALLTETQINQLHQETIELIPSCKLCFSVFRRQDNPFENPEFQLERIKIGIDSIKKAIEQEDRLRFDDQVAEVQRILAHERFFQNEPTKYKNLHSVALLVGPIEDVIINGYSVLLSYKSPPSDTLELALNRLVSCRIAASTQFNNTIVPVLRIIKERLNQPASFAKLRFQMKGFEELFDEKSRAAREVQLKILLKGRYFPFEISEEARKLYEEIVASLATKQA